MSQLNSLVARFVDELLDAIRRAAAEDAVDTRRRPKRAAPRRTERRRRAAASGRRGRPVPVALSAGEITDPERLLASVEAPSVPVPPQSGVTTTPRREAKSRRVTLEEPRAEAPAEPRAAIREGETIVRATAAGVVIRRMKKTEAEPNLELPPPRHAA